MGLDCLFNNNSWITRHFGINYFRDVVCTHNISTDQNWTFNVPLLRTLYLCSFRNWSSVGSHDNSVCTEARFGGLDLRGIVFRFSGGTIDSFLFSRTSRQTPDLIQPSLQWTRGAFSLGLKRPDRQADHSPFSAEVKNLRSCTSTSPHALIERCLLKHCVLTTSLWRHMLIWRCKSLHS
jgi:hypothetical protein